MPVTDTIFDGNSVVVDSLPDGFPPLMLVATRLISDQTRERIAQAVASALAQNKPLVIDGSFCAVHQLIDWRWQPLHTAGTGGDGDA